MKIENEQVSSRVIRPEEVKKIAVSDIIVGHRYREELGDIKSLAESINQNGLIHPIVVKRTVDNKYQLMAGGRRLEAVKSLGWERVTANIYPVDLDQLERNIIELCENIDRKEMSFAEQVALTRQIHIAMQAKLGEKRREGDEFKGHSVRDTAKLLGKSPTSVSDDIQLAMAIEAVPELAEAKNKAEAMKMLRRLKREQDLADAAELVSKRKLSSLEERRQRLINSYIVGDFFEKVKEVQSGIVDLVEVDTPYGIDLERQKKVKLHKLYKEAQIGEYNEWAVEEFVEKSKRVAEESFRILKESGWLIWWFAPDAWFDTLVNIIREAGFTINVAIPAIWFKPDGTGQSNNPDKYLSNVYETFFYARKGDAKIISQGRPNVFSFRRVNPSNKIHPTEKPIELLSDIFQTFVLPGSTIAVPFLGSGNSILAADNVGCSAFGWDLSEKYKNRYIERVMSNPSSMFRSFKEKEHGEGDNAI